MKITLNIGLEINGTYSESIAQSIIDAVEDCLQLASDALLLTVSNVETFTGKNGEETLEVKVDTLQGICAVCNWIESLSVVLQQDCIAYQFDGQKNTGELLGPNPYDCGFLAESFGRP